MISAPSCKTSINGWGLSSVSVRVGLRFCWAWLCAVASPREPSLSLPRSTRKRGKFQRPDSRRSMAASRLPLVACAPHTVCVQKPRFKYSCTSWSALHAQLQARRRHEHGEWMRRMTALVCVTSAAITTMTTDHGMADETEDGRRICSPPTIVLRRCIMERTMRRS